MKVVAIVQARMGSTRLPGKVLKDLAGETMLARVVERLHGTRLINEVLIATTDRPADDAIARNAARLRWQFPAAIKMTCSTVIFVRRNLRRPMSWFTSPLIALCSIQKLPTRRSLLFLEARPDYASNVMVRTYPRGLGTEVMSFDALARAWRRASKAYEREHVTPYIYEHSEEFKLLSVTGDLDYSGYRWTVDTPEDMEFVQAIYGRFQGHTLFNWRNVLALLDREPEIVNLNQHVSQKSL